MARNVLVFDREMDRAGKSYIFSAMLVEEGIRILRALGVKIPPSVVREEIL